MSTADDTMDVTIDYGRLFPSGFCSPTNGRLLVEALRFGGNSLSDEIESFVRAMKGKRPAILRKVSEFCRMRHLLEENSNIGAHTC